MPGRLQRRGLVLVVRNVSAVARNFQVAFDCADPERLAGFWAAALDYELLPPPGGHATWAEYSSTVAEEPGEAWAKIVDPQGKQSPLLFHRVPEAKMVKNRLHLDLRSTDLAAATEQAVALGATRADDVYDGGKWQVLRDPEGNELCLLRPRP